MQELSGLDGWEVEGFAYEYDEGYDLLAGWGWYVGVAAWTGGTGLGWYAVVEA